VCYTQNGSRLYVHIYTWPFRHLHLPGLSGKIEYAQLLNDGSEIEFTEHVDANWGNETQVEGTATLTLPVTTLTLPVIKPDVVVPVVELFLKDE
jgi:alpha-L-fucosidase